MGYFKEVLFGGDPVKEDLKDPFEDNYVEDETAINLCEVMLFLDGALLKKPTIEAIIMNIYGRHDGDDFRVEVHNLVTKFLEAGGDVPSVLCKNPYKFPRVADLLKEIQSVTASKADEATISQVSDMVSLRARLVVLVVDVELESLPVADLEHGFDVQPGRAK
jgi:hypothetical protein